ncbi:MAG TPA: hypothetical protein GX707_18025, partial [Epulopiscium sp.]|nr:hypothetical protein [Candidatus Epulonipiscium sp.]
MKIGYKEPEIPMLVPKPEYVYAISNPVMLLDGTWQVKHTKDWSPITVPSDMLAHKPDDFTGKYRYKRTIELPEDMINKELVLKFQAVNGFVKVYIDDTFVAEHLNGFVAWNINIRDYVKGREKFVLTIEVDETKDKVSTYNHGGIIGSVMLYSFADNYITSLHTTTTFVKDSNNQYDYTNCDLRIDFGVWNNEIDYDYKVQLYHPEDSRLVKSLKIESLEEDTTSKSITLGIKNPKLWDAEHPWLYQLELSIYKGEELLERVKQSVGFRQITRIKNQLFVNGEEVKLRGICRHEISPLNGRCVTKELTEQDVELFKEANCNYIRTSHYPPSEYFLQLCDEKGIYVEDELALAFIARTLDYTQRDPSQTERYLSHFAEVMARDYSHPSVIMWSLCNESFGGYNFDILNRFVHKMDPSRPTKFSYPMTMQEEHEPVDIWSVHYSNIEEDLAKKCDNVSVGYSPGYDMPVIHDEYAHIPCYNRTEHRRDPNVRNFWGESIKKFWDKIWNTKGALGGAIWAGIDETDIFCGGKTSLEWGIIDIWRRKKPEHYMTRKAYSPIVLPKGEVVLKENHMASLEIENRFCHTNLSEVMIKWKYGKLSGSFYGGQIKPREKGIIHFNLPIDASVKGCKMELTFMDAFRNKVDEYLLPLVSNKEEIDLSPAQHVGENIPLSYSEKEDRVVIKAREFHIEFSKRTGLLIKAISKGQSVLIDGPYMNVPYIKLGKWEKTDFKVKEDQGVITLITRGAYGKQMDVTFNIRIESDGSIKTQYTIDNLYAKLPKKLKLRVGVDCGGLDE